MSQKFPTTRDFMPIILAGLLFIALTCGFIGVNIERIGDAIAVSEEQP